MLAAFLPPRLSRRSSALFTLHCVGGRVELLEVPRAQRVVEVTEETTHLIGVDVGGAAMYPVSFHSALRAPLFFFFFTAFVVGKKSPH